MANTKTIDSVKASIDREGYCNVPISTVEHFAATSFDDDDALDAYLSAAVSGIEWITEYEVDWVNRTVMLEGVKNPSSGT